MITEKQFSLLVSREFYFMETEFQFIVEPIKTNNRQYTFDYKKDELMVRVPLEESIIQCAKLFKKFASSILEKKEWVSWGEIVGYHQYVPPNLP